MSDYPNAVDVFADPQPGSPRNNPSVSGTVRALIDGLTAVQAAHLDTGWRVFPQSSLTLDFTGQAGVVFRVAPLWRRVGDVVHFGAAVTRDTAWSGASGANVSRVFLAPAGMDLGVPSGNIVCQAFTSDTTVPGTNLFAFHASVTFQSYNYGIADPAVQLTVNPSAQIVPTGTPLVLRSQAGRWTDEPWPDSLPGTPYTP